MVLDYDKNPVSPIIGSITGMTEIKFDDGSELIRTDHDYTLNDLFKRLKYLSDVLQLDNFDYLLDLIHSHVNNLNNPHQTDLNKLSTSVVQELYKVWLSKGNTGNESTFLRILFQYVEIADIATTLEGKTFDKVVSVKGLYEKIKQHNDDPNAHEPLFSVLFPGAKLDTTPSLSLVSSVGLTKEVKVVRNGPMSYIGRDGYLSTAQTNELFADYGNSYPRYPIFSDKTNLLSNSEKFNDATLWEKNEVTISYHGYIPDLHKARALQLTDTITPASVHGIKSITPLNVVKDTVYTTSIYVYPLSRTCMGISMPNATGINSFAHFNLTTKKVYVQDAKKSLITGYIETLPNGWYRCNMVFKATANISVSPMFYMLDVYDGDDNYNGTGTGRLLLFGAQVNKGLKSCPYILTTNQPETVNATDIHMSVDNIYSSTQGTIVASYENITDSINLTADTINIFNITNASTTSNYAINARYTALDKNNILINARLVDDNNNLVTTNSTLLPFNNKNIINLAVSYKPGFLGIAYNDNIEILNTGLNVFKDVTILNIGKNATNTNLLDSYLLELNYYPTFMDEEKLKFLMGVY